MACAILFKGKFHLQKPFNPAEIEYLLNFSRSRRVKRDVNALEVYAAIRCLDNLSEEQIKVWEAVKRDIELRAAVKLPYGSRGEFFCSYTHPIRGRLMAPDDTIIADEPPGKQPGYWCQWIPSKDGKRLIYDGGEKFHHCIEWLRYIIKNFLVPWGYILNGIVEWRGEDNDDFGRITVKDNVVKVRRNLPVYYGGEVPDVEVENGEITEEELRAHKAKYTSP